MNRTITFTKRNLLEMLRDPLSYIFCVAFPLVMLVLMTIVNSSIPKEGITTFRIDNLEGGIVVFGQSFVMLFTALNVATDRNGSFLTRLFASPMKSREFANGYILPSMIISFVQTIISIIAAFIVSIIVDYKLSIAGLLITIVVAIPAALFFVAIGLIFGTLFSEKAAPGMCSIIISLAGFFGGIWFDAEAAGGVMGSICKGTPIFYCTKAIRSAIDMDFSKDSFVIPMIIVVASALVLTILSSVLFKSKMRADLA